MSRTRFPLVPWTTLVLAVWVGNVQAGTLPVTAAGDLKLHLAADVGVQLDAVTGDVEYWLDQSGNGNDATQATDDRQPILETTNTLNGRQVIRFDGSNDYLALPTPSTIGILNQDYEMFFVFRTTQTNVVFLIGGASTKYEVHLNGSAGARFLPADYDNGNEVSDLATSGTYADGQSHVLNARVDSGNSYRGLVRVDGVDSTDWTNSDARTTNDTALNLGSRTTSQYWYQGDLAEVLIYNRTLTVTERDSVEQYLNDRWTVPEPSTVVLLVLAGLCLAAGQCRRWQR